MMLQPHLSAPRAPRPYGSCYGEASVTNVTAAADNSSSTWGTCFSGDDAAMRKIDTEHEMLIKDELTFLAGLVALESLDIIELGCGKADMARELLRRYPDARVTGLEVDQVQHAKNRANPQAGLTFVAAGAQAIPFAQARFDLAVMLKSLHHIPQALMKQALDDIARVLKPGGLLYVSDPSLRVPSTTSAGCITMKRSCAATPSRRLMRHYSTENGCKSPKSALTCLPITRILKISKYGICVRVLPNTRLTISNLHRSRLYLIRTVVKMG